MNNKGVSITELLIVIIVMSIVASFTVIGVSEIVDNTRQNGFVAIAETFVDSAQTAYNSGASIWDDDVVTLRELVDNNYLENVDKDPWGGEYDLDGSFVSIEQVSLEVYSDESTIVLSRTINPSVIMATRTVNVYKVKLISSVAIIGYEEALEEFTTSDIHFTDGSGGSLFDAIVEAFTGNLDENLTTDNGDDEINVSVDIKDNAVVETLGGNDTVNIGDDIQGGGHLDTGDGNDTVNVSSDIKDNSSVDTGSGDDVINVSGEIKDSAVVDTGEGNDTINISDDLQSNSTLSTGEGDDTVTIGDDLQSGSVLDTGTGNDSVTVGDDLDDATLITGLGDDIMNINTIRDASTIDAGGDNDTLTITHVSSRFDGSVNMGAGNDTITIYDDSSSKDLSGTDGTFNGGSGTDTLNLPNVSLSQWNSYVSSLFSNFEVINLSDTTINN